MSKLLKKGVEDGPLGALYRPSLCPKKLDIAMLASVPQGHTVTHLAFGISVFRGTGQARSFPVRLESSGSCPITRVFFLSLVSVF